MASQGLWVGLLDQESPGNRCFCKGLEPLPEVRHYCRCPQLAMEVLQAYRFEERGAPSDMVEGVDELLSLFV